MLTTKPSLLALTIATTTSLAAPPTQAENSSNAVSSGTAFNPAISLILSGNYYADSKKGNLLTPAGLNNLTAGGGDNGFNLDESELVLSATVDPNFDAMANIVLADGEAEVEEAWFETRRLPYGLRVRAGKLKSNIGYLNSQHPHTWDFADQNLAYNALLGGEGISDMGVRMEWLPDWSLYTLFGTEMLQGKQDVVGVSQAELDPASALLNPREKSGPRLFSAYAKISPELSDNHALQVGLWGLRAKQQQEAYYDAATTDEYLLDGDESLYGLEAVYRYDGGGEAGHRSLKVQAEVLRGAKSLAVASLAGAPVFTNGSFVALGDAVNSQETAFYLQAVYGILPRWQAGLRVDQSGIGSHLKEAGISTDYSESKRVSGVVTWNLTEFSRLRANIAG